MHIAVLDLSARHSAMLVLSWQDVQAFAEAFGVVYALNAEGVTYTHIRTTAVCLLPIRALY